MHAIVYIVLSWIRYFISTAVFFCLVIVVHKSLVCPEQLNCLLFFRKIIQLPQIIWFFSIFVYLNPFQQWFWDPSFNTEGLIRNYYRGFKHSLMLQKENPCIKSRGVKTFEQNEDVYICLILLKYIFPFSIPTKSTEDTYMFPRRSNKSIDQFSPPGS